MRSGPRRCRCCHVPRRLWLRRRRHGRKLRRRLPASGERTLADGWACLWRHGGWSCGSVGSAIASWCTDLLPHQVLGPTLSPSSPHPSSSPFTPCRYEEDVAVLRALRMVLRDLTYKLLGNKKWEWFWEPEEDPEWWDKVRGWLELQEEVWPSRSGGWGAVGLAACWGLVGPSNAGLGGLRWASIGLPLDLPPSTPTSWFIASHSPSFQLYHFCTSTGDPPHGPGHSAGQCERSGVRHAAAVPGRHWAHRAGGLFGGAPQASCCVRAEVPGVWARLQLVGCRTRTAH